MTSWLCSGKRQSSRRRFWCATPLAQIAAGETTNLPSPDGNIPWNPAVDDGGWNLCACTDYRRRFIWSGESNHHHHSTFLYRRCSSFCPCCSVLTRMYPGNWAAVWWSVHSSWQTDYTTPPNHRKGKIIFGLAVRWSPWLSVYLVPIQKVYPIPSLDEYRYPTHINPHGSAIKSVWRCAAVMNAMNEFVKPKRWCFHHHLSGNHRAVVCKPRDHL